MNNTSGVSKKQPQVRAYRLRLMMLSWPSNNFVSYRPWEHVSHATCRAQDENGHSPLESDPSRPPVATHELSLLFLSPR